MQLFHYSIQNQQYIASPAHHSHSVVAAAPVAYVQSQSPYDYHTYAYSYIPMQSAASSQAGSALYQPTMLQGMAPYNPSYLVSQSNQLFNQHQHQQNLYKQQEPSYIQEFAQNSLNYNPYAAKLQQQQQQQPQYNTYDVATAQLQQIQALQAGL